MQQIKNYIIFLKNSCGLQISLHASPSDMLFFDTELMSFNIHANSYCVYVKTLKGAKECCIDRQRCLLEGCSEKSFIDVCHAGVKEYVYPVKLDGEVRAFICVTGYRDGEGEPYTDKTALEQEGKITRLREAYSQLKLDMPDKPWVDTLITPLARMLELVYLKGGAKRADKSEGIAERASIYLRQHHRQRVTVDCLADYLGFSRSHVSHTFKKETGKSVSEYLTDVRVEDAQALLKYTSLSVTEISFSVGFTDSNYFSSTFKAKTGYTPGAYRKRHKNK